jgi:hypothetical protein
MQTFAQPLQGALNGDRHAIYDKVRAKPPGGWCDEQYQCKQQDKFHQSHGRNNGRMVQDERQEQIPLHHREFITHRDDAPAIGLPVPPTGQGQQGQQGTDEQDFGQATEIQANPALRNGH